MIIAMTRSRSVQEPTSSMLLVQGCSHLSVLGTQRKPNPIKFNPLITLWPAVVLLVMVQIFFSLALFWFLPSGKLLQQLEMVSSQQSSQF